MTKHKGKQQGADRAALESQRATFITALHNTGWRTLAVFVDGGHSFELLTHGLKRILVQVYPDGHGFEVWRPVTESASIAETAVAVAAYAVKESTNVPRAETSVQHKTNEGPKS